MNTSCAAECFRTANGRGGGEGGGEGGGGGEGEGEGEGRGGEVVTEAEGRKKWMRMK